MDFDNCVDFTNVIDPFDLPLCPFCDDSLAIEEGNISYIKAYGIPLFAHTSCIWAARKEHKI